MAYEQPDASKLRTFAMDAVLQGMNQPGFAHLQTVILLLVDPPADPQTPDHATKWSLVGTMVTIAQAIGLQYDPSDFTAGLEEIILRKRLSWVVKMVDVWHAAILGRSCLICEDDWLITSPKKEEVMSPDGKLDDTLACLFLEMYELTTILKGVLSTLQYVMSKCFRLC